RIEALCGAPSRPAADPFPQSGDTRLFFKVQEGCDVRCSFCVIPDARGSARSLAPERVLAMMRAARTRGYEEVVLCGIHLGAYGRAPGPRPPLAELCARVPAEPDFFGLRLGWLEPWGVRPDLVQLLADEPRFLPMLHLPLQSGSERILRAMRRPMTAARYLEVVEQVFAARPELALYLDVLVGFPGESDADFAATVRFLDQFPWTKLHAFP